MATPAARTLLRKLELPYESVKTLYEGDSEVRLYRNELIDELQVGKRFDTLGLETTLIVNEGQLLKRIRHANVVPVHDVVVPTGYDPAMNPVELIMPYYKRGSLADAFLAGERFSIGQAVQMMTGALLGLAEIHECHGVLHRDLKSPNLFLDDVGRLLVGDLGVSVAMEADGMGEAHASPRVYCPPETFTARRVGRSADIFQLGLVLHELASGPLDYGAPEFALEEMAERLVIGKPAVRPRHLQSKLTVPPRLRRVINKATRIDPEGRYANAKQMIDALANVPYVDWRQVVDERNHKRWEGATVHRPDRRFAVEATQRTGGWSLVGQQHVSTWRRMTGRPDAIVSGLADSQAAAFFDSMVAIAVRT